MANIKEISRKVGGELTKPTQFTPKPERLGVGGAIIAGLAAKEGIIPQEELGSYILRRLMASSNIDYDIHILPQIVRDKLSTTGNDLNARAEDVARLALAQQGGKNPSRFTRIFMVWLHVMEQYLEASKTAAANRVARLFNGDLTPEKYLSEEALKAIGIVANKQESLQKELSTRKFSMTVNRSTQDIWKEIQGLILGREMLNGEKELSENEKVIAKAIAVQAIRENIESLSDFKALVARTVESNNIDFIKEVFVNNYERARKAELGKEIKTELNPNDNDYVSVIRIKPMQLLWNSLLDEEELVEETVEPAFIAGESGHKGIEIKMDVRNGNIVVIKGGSNNDTEIFPAQETSIFWRQYDPQSIFSDSVLFKKVRRLLMFQGQNMEVGQIILYNQISKKIAAIPIITRMPEYDSALEDKPIEGGGVALSLGLHVLKNAFSFAEEAEDFINNGRNDQNDQIQRIEYAESLTKTEILENHYRVKPVEEASKKLIKNVRQRIIVNRIERDKLIDQIKHIADEKEKYERISQYFLNWLKRNKLLERYQKTRPEGRKTIINQFCDEVGFDVIAKRKEIMLWLQEHSNEWQAKTSAIQTIEIGEKAILEDVSIDELSQ